MLVDHHCHLDCPGVRRRPRWRGRQGEGGRRRHHRLDLDAHAAAWRTLLAIAEAYPNVFCSVGTHPHYAHRSSTFPSRRSCGCRRIPRSWRSARPASTISTTTARARRRLQGFRNHIAAAQETGLPLVIHARDADDDIAAILEEEMAKRPFPAVLHCFTGGAELARRALDLGLYISFSGILTFKKSDALREIAASVPLDRLLVETDAPYLAPGKYRGKRNEPAYVVHTAAELAQGQGHLAGRAGAGHHRQLLPALCQDAAGGARRMSTRFTHSGLRLLRRRAAHRQHLGQLRSSQPEEPAAALRPAGRALRQGRARTTVLVDTPPDIREQLLGVRVDDARRRALHARPCRPHARHRRPARRVLQCQAAHRRLRRRAHARHPDAALRLLLRAAAGLGLSRHPDGARHRPARARAHRRRGRRHRGACRSCRSTATCPRWAFVSATSPTRRT